MTDIKVIHLGYVNAFLLNSCVLVDTGTKGCDKSILSYFTEHEIDPKQVKLIIITHAHSDHIGSVGEMIESTGAKALIHDLEYKQLNNEIDSETKPTSTISKIIFNMDKKMNKRNPSSVFDADIIVDDEYDLSEYGVDGKIVTTPGHTLGSISIILDEITAIIGDSLMAFVPNSKPKKPIIAYDLGLVKKSMNELIDMGITEYYLSHGKSYGVDVITEAVKRL